MNTLTLDDNPMILQSMKKLLSRIDPEGVHLTADSAAEALESIRQPRPRTRPMRRRRRQAC